MRRQRQSCCAIHQYAKTHVATTIAYTPDIATPLSPGARTVRRSPRRGVWHESVRCAIPFEQTPGA